MINDVMTINAAFQTADATVVSSALQPPRGRQGGPSAAHITHADGEAASVRTSSDWIGDEAFSARARAAGPGYPPV
jgi:hypothetical protein